MHLYDNPESCLRPGPFRAAMLCAVLALAGCGGGSQSADSSGAGGGSNSVAATSGTGSLNLRVTDGPVDEADHVWVQFSSVTLKPADGEPFTVKVGTETEEFLRIDLLAQQGGLSAALLENEEVPAGDYEWIRLGVDLGARETVIIINGQEHDLWIPSGAQTGLKLVSHFTVLGGTTVNLTIDFDLRKSVICAGSPTQCAASTASASGPPADKGPPEGTGGKGPPQEVGEKGPPDDVGRVPRYMLKPALRLVRDEEVGEILASATSNYIFSAGEANCSNPNGEVVPAAYVFAGSGVEPDDVNTADDTDVDPITSVLLTDTGETNELGDPLYTGIAAFLPAGDYTVAFTCNPEADVADEDDHDATDLENADLVFLDARDVTVETGETATYELP